MLRPAVVLLGLALVGCGERPVVEVPATHPASVDAEPAPAPALSTTLAVTSELPSPGADVPHRQIDQPDLDGRTSTDGEHAEHAGKPSGAEESQAHVAGSAAGPAPEADHQDHEHGGMSAPGTSDSSYTCRMHPEVLTKQPGRCPICNMKLIPKKEAAK